MPKYENRPAERIARQEAIQRLLATDIRDGDRVLPACAFPKPVGYGWRNVLQKGAAGQITVFGEGGPTKPIARPQDLRIALTKLRSDVNAVTRAIMVWGFYPEGPTSLRSLNPPSDIYRSPGFVLDLNKPSRVWARRPVEHNVNKYPLEPRMPKLPINPVTPA